jgi:hypothetical protein
VVACRTRTGKRPAAARLHHGWTRHSVPIRGEGATH